MRSIGKQYIGIAAAVLVAWFGLGLLGRAAMADDVPALTETQRLQVQNLALVLEVAQLRAKVAQADFDTAKAALLKMVAGLQKDGFDLDLNTMTYRRKPPAVAQEGGK